MLFLRRSFPRCEKVKIPVLNNRHGCNLLKANREGGNAVEEC
jgi:hypothetical protein